ncbi:hypothetical protein ACTMTI_15865 [Nonomuraea sp. H19]|uniref:hypothetical protein n=1 Tax=Nonomuraea sp. H19 TaxID=3452206 RepID=UPI003F8A69CC
MNPGSEYEPPRPPYQVPGRQFEPPTMPPGMPTMPPKRPAWLLPTLAAILVVLVAAAGVGAYFVYGKVSGASRPPADAQTGKAPSEAFPDAAAGPDVCAMLPEDEAERLVPAATVAKSSRDGDHVVTFSCDWVNLRISYGEYWRDRRIEVRVQQHKGHGAKTGRAMAQNSYELDYRQGKFVETAKPSLDPGEKEYKSPVKDIPGVGDGAFAQYTWRRDEKLQWYAFGEAYARAGDMTIKVKFQAGQQRKDAQMLSNDTTRAITEENAIREVSGLIPHFAKGAAAWQAKNPGVLAQPDPSPATTRSPSARPTPSPTVLATFPDDCGAVTEVATRLVPEPATRARGTEVGADRQTECRWLNLELPGGAGVKKIRSALITVHRFTNRVGGDDQVAAKSFYEREYGGDKNMAESSIGGITWGKIANVKGLGDQAYQQYLTTRGRGAVSASTGMVLMRKGAVVVSVDFSGHQRPEGDPTNSPEVKFMPEKEALAGALTLARAYLTELTKQPVGG